MKRSESWCPMRAIVLSKDIPVWPSCAPESCMWAMRKTAKGEDGSYRTVGYRCAIATGSDRYIELEEASER